MRQATLRCDKDGIYTRSVGYKVTASGKRDAAKFRLGRDRRIADQRFGLIAQLWQYIESQRPNPVWTEWELSIAKRYERGEIQIPFERKDTDNGHSYATKLHRTQKLYPIVHFVPTDQDLYAEGLAFNQSAVDNSVKNLDDCFLVPDSIVSKPCKMTLHKAFAGYIKWIEKDYSNADGITDNGMTKIKQVNNFLQRFADRPLNSVDQNACEEMFQYLRKRPPTLKTGQPMKRKTCQNLIGELTRFFSWLDGHHDWELPSRFGKIKRIPDDLEADEAHEAKQVPVYSVDEIKTLYFYATPLERLLLLLGLNCAFGADQAGRLRVGEIVRKEKGTYIVRIRFKKKVEGRHRLWAATIAGLDWMLAQRETKAIQPGFEKVLIVDQNGEGYWRKTKGGNRDRKIAKLWGNLLQRISVEHPQFRKLGFNSLRDTSINMVRQMAGAELASLQGTHKHQSADKNLISYSQPRFVALFKVHRKMERRLTTVFESVADPFGDYRKSYLGKSKSQRVVDLYNAGTKLAEIAKTEQIAPSTIYRLLDAAGRNARRYTKKPR